MDPGHPRINEAESGLDNQEANTETAEQEDKLTAGQAAQDDREDSRMQRQLNRDKAKHSSYVTKAEQHRLNREMRKERHQKRMHEYRDYRRREEAENAQ